MDYNKKIKVLFIFFMCLILIMGKAYSQGTTTDNSKTTPVAAITPESSTDTKTDKTGSKAEIININVEVLKLEKLDVSAGKYSAEIGIYVKYPELQVPEELEYDVFKNEIMPKLKDFEEFKKELESYYIFDDKNYVYKLKENLKPEQMLSIYKILKAAEYYARNLPFDIVNGKIEEDEKKGKLKIEITELDPTDPTYLYYKAKVEMSAKLDFKNFPFDTQNLSIKFENPYTISVSKFAPFEDLTLLPVRIEYGLLEKEVLNNLNEDEKKAVLNGYQANDEKTAYDLKDNVSKEDEKKIKKIFNRMGVNTLIDPGVKLLGWKVREGEEKYGTNSYAKEKYSTYTFPITATRNPFTSFMKVMVPLFILILASLISLFLGTSILGNRYAVTAAFLLACALLHLNVTSSLPQIGYLTIADKIFISSYLSLFLSLCASVAMVFFNERKQEKNLKLAYSTPIWLVPILTILLYLLVFLKVL